MSESEHEATLVVSKLKLSVTVFEIKFQPLSAHF